VAAPVAAGRGRARGWVAAAHAVGLGRHEALRDAVREAAADPDPDLSDTAAWALVRLDSA